MAGTSSDGMMLTSGTSISPPLAAGVAALLKSVEPGLTGADLRTKLIKTASEKATLTASVSGGRVDARAALAHSKAPLAVEVEGLSALAPDKPGAYTVGLTGTGVGLPEGPQGLTQRLVTQEHDGGVYDVAGADMDAGAAGSDPTDAGGLVKLTPGGLTAAGLLAGGIDVAVTTTLPTGRYALLLQLTSEGDPVGEPHAAPFIVGAPAAADSSPPTPPAWPTRGQTAPASPSPGSSTLPTVAPSSAAPAPGA